MGPLLSGVVSEIAERMNWMGQLLSIDVSEIAQRMN